MLLTVDSMASWSDHNKLEMNVIYIEIFSQALLYTIAETNRAYMKLILIYPCTRFHVEGVEKNVFCL